MKKWVLIFLCLVLILSTSANAFALQTQPPKVVDDANLLTEDAYNRLSERAEEIAERYNMDVVIVTINDMNGDDAESFADDYFDYNGYGLGSHYSGVLFLVCMGTHDWHVSTCGYAIRAYNRYAMSDTRNEVITYLSSGDYEEAFDCWLSIVEKYYEAYELGDDTVYKGAPNYGKMLIISGAFGLVVALIVILIMRSTMNSAKARNDASEYLKCGSYRLTTQRDIFLYSRVMKTRKPSDSDGSTHTSSSGRCHGGGGGKF